MTKYVCDVCGGQMPERYIRPKRGAGRLASVCQLDDVCPACAAAGETLDIHDVLLTAWRALPRCEGVSPADPPEPLPLEERAEAKKAPPGRGGTEKAVIAGRLRQYRREHGLGCLSAVAEKAGGLTDDMLRELLQGEIKLDIGGWRQIGRALDLLEEGQDGGADG